ncbi:MAG TPA: hypothetical protein O0X32_00335 [Methanocorpusculum sp.]|nr:hypothetical protein [Methanocorpusculum sp.]
MIEVDTLQFIEPEYSSLINNGEPAILICDAKPKNGDARILVDEEENPLLFAVKNENIWYATAWIYRLPTAEELALFEEAEGDMYQEPRSDIEKALREYFMRKIIREGPPAGEDITADRIEKMRSLIHEKFGESVDGLCIDACCGSGIGAMIMREMGASVLAYDNDPELLRLGIKEGRLLAEDTLCLDGGVASAYLMDAKYGLGIMLGQMYTYTKDIWKPIVEEIAGITQKTLITVATEEEAHWVKEWADGVGKDLEISENNRDFLYDRWVCFG